MRIKICPVCGRGYVLFVDGEAHCDSSDFGFLLECARSLISETALIITG